MSFFTLVSNHMPNLTRMPNTMQIHPQYAMMQRLISISFIILVLSTALRNSILCY